MANPIEKQEASCQNKYPLISSIWVLGAGHGTRLQSTGYFKPWIPIAGRPLLLHTLDRLLPFQKPLILILHPAQKEIDRSAYSEFQNPLVHLVFKETPSSMHTLWEAWQFSKQSNTPLKEGWILVSLVDPILDPLDWTKFINELQTLKTNESMVLGSRFVDDEKPLYVWTDPKCPDSVLKFTGEPPITTPAQVTAGIYCFSVAALPLLDQCFKAGQMHLRNFLQKLIDAKLPVRVFTVDKTIDIDRPEDVETANTFLKKGR